MYIRVPEEIVNLAKIFKKNNEKLYLVGGFVRNQIIGIPDSHNLDIDICSSARPEKVFEILSSTSFAVKYLSEELGVVEIKNNLRVEHATFRKEKYSFSGAHIPNNVEFIKDIKEDAKRRDFRCNAIYYDILEEEIVDPLGGVQDAEKKLIRTTLDPKIVFKDDAERILRMVRFACTLGFNIDSETYKQAKENVYKLKYISSTRKREEFSEIVLADTKYRFLPDVKFAHARGIAFLADLGALEYILPALEAIRVSGIIEDRGKLLYEHVMNVFALSAPEVRLSALLHDAGKAKAFLEYRNFNGSEEYTPVIIEKNLGQEGLCYSKKIVERVKRVVLGLDFNKSGFEIAKNIKRFIVQNYEDIELIIKLKNAIALDKSNNKHISYSARILQKYYKRMKDSKTPMCLAELNIKGDNLIERYPNLKLNTIGTLLNELLYKCVDKPYKNNLQDLQKLSDKIVTKNKSFYME